MFFRNMTNQSGNATYSDSTMIVRKKRDKKKKDKKKKGKEIGKWWA